MLEKERKEIARTVNQLFNQANVSMPSQKELKKMAEKHGIKTEFGNRNFSSSVRNRSAPLTVVIGSKKVMEKELSAKKREILENASTTIKKVHAYLKKAPLVCIQRTMGQNSFFSPKCTLFFSVHRKDCIRVPFMWSQSLFDLKENSKPHLQMVFIPEWQEKDRQILVFPIEGITFVLGTDYFGEAKKGFLRMAMWKAKEKGMLGIHAGTKLIKARNVNGKIETHGMLLFGLTATGKTTHTCHNHGLTGKGEKSLIVQDDVVFLKKDGSALGTEKGFFIKTDGLNQKTQPLLFKAITKKDAVMENVLVDFKGKVDFSDLTLTGNGRAVIQRKDLGKNASKSINLPSLKKLDSLKIVFITRRNTVLPIVLKLSPEQAAAAFMLGESIESSGGDPKRAGESVRVVGTNPFIIGNEAREGNRFYEFIKKNEKKVECFLLNTGGIGEIIKEKKGKKILKQKALNIGIPESAAVIRGIARNTIEWKKEPYFNSLAPKKVEGIDLNKFELQNFYSKKQVLELVKKLKKERTEFLKQFNGLNPRIIKAVKE